MGLTEIELLEILILVQIAGNLATVFWLGAIRGRQR